MRVRSAVHLVAGIKGRFRRAVDDMDLVQVAASRYTRGSVLVELSPVPAEVQLLFDHPVVLALEEDHTALGNKKSKLVLLLIIQLRELHTIEGRADGLCQITNSTGGTKEGALGFIGEQATIGRWVERSERFPVHVWEGGLEIVERIVGLLLERFLIVMFALVLRRTVRAPGDSVVLDVRD